MEISVPPALSLSYLGAAGLNGRCVWSPFCPFSKGMVSPCSVCYVASNPQRVGVVQGAAWKSLLFSSKLSILVFLQIWRLLVWSSVLWRWEVSDSFQELRNSYSSEPATQVAEMNRKWTTKQLHGVGSRVEVQGWEKGCRCPCCMV